MSEYCGCQAVAAIDLHRDHDGALDHVREAEQEAAAPNRARKARRQLQAVLSPKIAVEEQAIIPAQAAGFPSTLGVLEAERRRVESVSDGRRDRGPTWQIERSDAMSMLRVHIRKERDGVFGSALATMTVPERQTLENIRASVGSVLAGTS